MYKIILLTFISTFGFLQFAFSQQSIQYLKPQEIRDSVFFMIQRGQTEKACTLLNETASLGVDSERRELLFSVQEKILSDFILGNYNTIIQDAQRGYNEVLGYPFENIDEFNEYYLEATDTLEELLMNVCKKEYAKIAEQVNKDKSISLDLKKFLLIKLEYSSNYGKFCSFDGASLIANANEFIDESNDSLLIAHTKDLIWDNDYSKIGAGSSVYMGSPVFTGEMGEAFNSPFMYGLALDFSFKNLRLFSHWGVTTKINTTSSIEEKEGWTAGDKALMPHLNIGLGYNVLQTKTISLFPYLGIHASGMKNVSDSPLFEDTPGNLSSKYNPLGGLIVDYNFIKKHCDNYLLRNKERKMVFVRLQSLYSRSVYGSTVSGDMFFVALGLGIYTDHNGY